MLSSMVSKDQSSAAYIRPAMSWRWAKAMAPAAVGGAPSLGNCITRPEWVSRSMLRTLEPMGNRRASLMITVRATSSRR